MCFGVISDCTLSAFSIGHTERPINRILLTSGLLAILFHNEQIMMDPAPSILQIRKIEIPSM